QPAPGLPEPVQPSAPRQELPAAPAESAQPPMPQPDQTMPVPPAEKNLPASPVLPTETNPVPSNQQPPPATPPQGSAYRGKDRIRLESEADNTRLQAKLSAPGVRGVGPTIHAQSASAPRRTGPGYQVQTLPNATESDPPMPGRIAGMALNRYDSVSTFTPSMTPPRQEARPQIPNEGTKLVEHVEPVAASVELAVQLDGYCPVELVENEKWTSGKREWSVVHRGRLYLVSGPEQQKRFLANPDRYAPVLAGMDPVLFLDETREVPGKTDFCLVYDGRLYAFSSRASLAEFRQNPRLYADLARQPGAY
ncbi:MAG: hypothetical protein HUU20_23560, partial [Pirellulales bacterium]|nr:hypothetical protein [Pirellulales bacterium]